jgi:hypothetical protein
MPVPDCGQLHQQTEHGSDSPDGQLGQPEIGMQAAPAARGDAGL